MGQVLRGRDCIDGGLAQHGLPFDDSQILNGAPA